MPDRLLDALAEGVTRRRRGVLRATATFAVVCAAGLPRLRTDTSLGNLIVSYGGYEERVREFHRHLGDTDSIVALLVKAPDANALEPLCSVHRVSRHLSDEPFVARVASLTVCRLAGTRRDRAELTLDSIGDAEPPAIEARTREELGALPGVRWTTLGFSPAMRMLFGGPLRKAQ
jgi:predicted RND superfamily exporter protein